MCTLWNYKSVPKCCIMITNKMTLWMTKHIPTLTLTHPFIAIIHWVVLGCYASFCALEWWQTLQHTYKCITFLPLQPPEAFIMEDFEFFLDREIPVADITPHPSATVASVPIWRHTQKNKQNSEKIPFFCDTINPWLCPVTAVICIVQQVH